MSDLIRREDALDAIQKRADIVNSVHSAFWEGLIIAYSLVQEVPSAKPERHRGEWIEDGHERGFSECSKCGYIAVSVLSERHYNFCPNCGADMRGE